MRATIKSISDNRVTVTETNHLGERVTTEYFAPMSGGYVRIDEGNRYPQVCAGLVSTGPALEWHPSHGPLVNMIRRERASYIRDVRREESRRGF